MNARKVSGKCRKCGGVTYVGDRGLCEQCRALKAKKAERSAKAHAKRVDTVYGITADEYALILAEQGGVCAICGRAPRAKRLAVDHDHALFDHLVAAGWPHLEAMRQSVRGLLCRNDNFHVLGMLDRDALLRAVDYLDVPPAQQILGGG